MVDTQLRERVVAARKSADLSQQELADAVGLQATAISKIENGSRDVSSTELSLIARKCGKSLSWFFNEGDDDAVVSFRATGTVDQSLEDLAWASEFAEAYRFLKKALECTH